MKELGAQTSFFKLAKKLVNSLELGIFDAYLVLDQHVGHWKPSPSYASQNTVQIISQLVCFVGCVHQILCYVFIMYELIEEWCNKSNCVSDGCADIQDL